MRSLRTFLIITILSWFITQMVDASSTSGTIDTTNRYAWGENVGWIDFGSSQGSVAITDTAMTGYAWGENVGWISLNCSNTSSCGTVDYGVSNSNGTLGGYAWGENVGWIDFDPTYGGVSISSDGVFSGSAWGENVGWIIFNCNVTSSCATVDYTISTDYRPANARPACNNASDDDGDGRTDYPTDPGCSSLTDTSELNISGGGPAGPPGSTVVFPGSTPQYVTPAPPTLIENSLWKRNISSTVYVGMQGVLRPILNAHIFEAYGFSWDAIQIVNTIPFFPIGDPLDYSGLPLPPGAIIKGSDAHVYLVYEGKRRWFSDWETFSALGYTAEQIRQVNDTTIASYQETTPSITDATRHPNGSLITYETGPEVYFIDNGVKRWIRSESIFSQLGFRFSDVVTIPDSETYADGTDIEGPTSLSS